MEQIVGALRNEKLSSTLLVLLVIGAWWAQGWADARYVEKSEFTQLRTTVKSGFDNIEINNASQIVRDIKLEIKITKAASGSDQEITRLQERLEQAKNYKSCLVEQKPNCEHIKDIE